MIIVIRVMIGGLALLMTESEVWAERKASAIYTTTLYIHGVQKSISECKTITGVGACLPSRPPVPVLG